MQQRLGKGVLAEEHMAKDSDSSSQITVAEIPGFSGNWGWRPEGKVSFT